MMAICTSRAQMAVGVYTIYSTYHAKQEDSVTCWCVIAWQGHLLCHLQQQGPAEDYGIALLSAAGLAVKASSHAIVDLQVQQLLLVLVLMMYVGKQLVYVECSNVANPIRWFTSLVGYQPSRYDKAIFEVSTSILVLRVEF
jgi:hypothetical protein